MPAKKHAHKYKRTFLDRKKEVPVWRCILPGCSHYVRKEFLEGRIALCWRCGNEFVLQEKHARYAKPTCCTKALNEAIEIVRADAERVKNEERDLTAIFRSLPNAEAD